MKTITFLIPTSMADFKQMRKEFTSKRYRENVYVVRRLIDRIISIANDGYWRGHISESMRDSVFRTTPYSPVIKKIYNEAISNLK